MSGFTASGRVPVHTDEGYTLAPGETTDLIDPTLPLNARQIDAGVLVRNAERKPTTKAELLEEAKRLDIAGRTRMSPEELQTAIDAAKAPPPPNPDTDAHKAEEENH
jgi:hypothetical protein